MNRELLRAEMNKRNMNASELAELANVEKSTISRILSGETACTVATAGKIAQAMRLSNKATIQIFFED